MAYNLIFYFSDQQRWDTCGCYGQPLVITPNLDALAAEYLFETNEGREYRLHEQASLPVLGVPSCDVPALTAEGGLL